MFTDPVYTHYFGFDLGDGESAISWLHSSARTEPQMLEIRGKKSFISAIAETPGGEIIIGEDAFRATKLQSLNARFKSGFLHDPDESAKHIALFAKAVHRELLEAGRIPDEDKACFFIGCPSGWSQPAREKYRSIFEDAGFKNVEIVPESRAAFMYARESHELHVSSALLGRSVLIIDAGSSTTDFTGVVDLREVNLGLSASDFGETRLGGGLIEKALLDLNIQRCDKSEEVTRILNAYPQYAARGELEARKVKELYFTAESRLRADAFAMPCESSFKIYYNIPPLTVDITCAPDDMDFILNQPMPELEGKSILSAFKGAMLTSREALREHPPQTVLLTGGASRMGFIYDMAKEIFKEAVIVRGVEPEFAIARGLCLTIRVQRKTALFRECVSELIASDAVEEIVLSQLPELLFDISGAIADEMIETLAIESFKRWKKGQLETFDDIEAEIKRNIEAYFRGGEIAVKIRPLVERWLKKLGPRVEAVTDPICDMYDIPRTSLHLPTIIEIAEIPLELDTVFGMEGARVLIDLIVASVTAMLIGGGGTFLIPGPIGLIVGFGAGLIASTLSTRFAAKWVKGVTIPRVLRAAFPIEHFRKGLSRKKERITQSVYDQFNINIDRGTENIGKLVDGFAKSIEQQLWKMADEAALIIH